MRVRVRFARERSSSLSGSWVRGSDVSHKPRLFDRSEGDVVLAVESQSVAVELESDRRVIRCFGRYDFQSEHAVGGPRATQRDSGLLRYGEEPLDPVSESVWTSHPGPDAEWRAGLRGDGSPPRAYGDRWNARSEVKTDRSYTIAV